MRYVDSRPGSDLARLVYPKGIRPPATRLRAALLASRDATVAKKVRFEINTDANEPVELGIGAKLAQLATLVAGHKNGC